MEFKCMAVVDGVPRQVTLSNPTKVYYDLQELMDIDDIKFWIETYVGNDDIDIYGELESKYSKEVRRLAKDFRHYMDATEKEFMDEDVWQFAHEHFMEEE